jgi:hypothetical protein
MNIQMRSLSKPHAMLTFMNMHFLTTWNLGTALSFYVRGKDDVYIRNHLNPIV